MTTHLLRYATLLTALPLFGLAACDRDDDDGGDDLAATLYWRNTLCADPWDSTTDLSAEEALEAYLRAEGLAPLDVLTDEDDAAEVFCEACTCSDGVVYVVTLAEADAPAAVELGFSRTRP